MNARHTACEGKRIRNYLVKNVLSSFTETPNFALIAEIAKIALNVLVRADRGDREIALNVLVRADREIALNVLVRADREDREIALNVLVRADREDRDFDRGPPVRGFKEISITFSDPEAAVAIVYKTKKQ